MIIPDFIKDYIKKSTDKSNRLSSVLLKCYYTSKIDTWIKQYPELSFIHIFYLLQNQISDVPLCPTCGKQVLNFYKGKIYCSNKCAQQSKVVRNKIKATNKQKYGYECVLSNSDIQNKFKQTCLEKYGTDNPAKSENIQNKIEQTCLEKYGTKRASESNSVKSKIKNSCKNIDDNIIEHRKVSNLEKYGVEYPLQSKIIQEKQKQTCLEKYGTEYTFSSKEIQEKIKATNLERYGYTTALQSEIVKEKHKNQLRNSRYPIIKQQLALSNRYTILSSEYEFIHSDLIRYKCNICNTEFTSNKSNIQHIVCPECSKKWVVSEKEFALRNFIKFIYNGTIIYNDKTILNGKELDIYIPEKKLAIEFNGTYWHSEKYKDSLYHLNKTNMCLEKGIRLIHIFEHEWDTKFDIVKSILKNALGLIDTKIYARKCVVKEISSSDYKMFLNLNHIQGSINSKYKYGLYYNDELVSVIGFGSSRFKKGELELHRFCSKLNYSVIGAFTKLIHYFVLRTNSSEFYTYVDRAHFNGNGYYKAGFDFISYTEPSYIYTKGYTILSRYQTQKHKLSKLLEHYDSNLSESDNMAFNGFLKVYDCGNIKLVYKKK